MWAAVSRLAVSCAASGCISEQICLDWELRAAGIVYVYIALREPSSVTYNPIWSCYIVIVSHVHYCLLQLGIWTNNPLTSPGLLLIPLSLYLTDVWSQIAAVQANSEAVWQSWRCRMSCQKHSVHSFITAHPLSPLFPLPRKRRSCDERILNSEGLKSLTNRILLIYLLLWKWSQVVSSL